MYGFSVCAMVLFIALVVVVLCTLPNQLTSTYTSSSASSDLTAIGVELSGQGIVLGTYDNTLWSNQTYMQFRGIPYAESPSGKLRFKASVPRLPWRLPLLATKYGRRCPVISTVSRLPETELNKDLEDCLNLCVFTKNLTARQPVMFYIYGGGFYNGTAEDHPPKFLLEQDIVLVVPNYRLGALGWLSTYSDELPGNAAIADVLLALQWVQRHIAAFGGDPQQVTVFGQSAGSAIASALLLSPKTPMDSIQRAIVQSGSIFAAWAIAHDPLAQAIRICKALGCLGCANMSQLHACLLSAQVKELLQATQSELFSPIAGDLQGILPQNPNALLGKFSSDIPLMTGFTKHDGSFMLAIYYDAIKASMGNLSEVSVRHFSQGLINMANDKTDLSDQLLKHMLFTPQLLAGYDHKQALPSYFDLTNDIFMKSPVISLATKWFARQSAPVYVYSFEYEGKHTRFGYELGNDHYPFNGGIHHSNDNIYIFNTHELNSRDARMARKMVDLWTSFATNGIPHVNGEVELPALASEDGPYFRINEEFSIGDDLLQVLTTTLDDPDKATLIKFDVEF